MFFDDSNHDTRTGRLDTRGLRVVASLNYIKIGMSEGMGQLEWRQEDVDQRGRRKSVGQDRRDGQDQVGDRGIG